jgi:hypothetical protein
MASITTVSGLAELQQTADRVEHADLGDHAVDHDAIGVEGRMTRAKVWVWKASTVCFSTTIC